jgi:KaiC/GvpD/RAD55 family RecA-like ATPase
VSSGLVPPGDSSSLSEAEQHWLADGDSSSELFRRRESNPEPLFVPRIYTLRELQETPEPEPEPIAPYVAYGGQLTMLAGREKSGKSTLARAGSAAVSSGAEFLGSPAIRGRVLYLALEESRGSVARSFAQHGADVDNVLIVSRMSESNSARIEFLSDTINQEDIDLVVIDTMLAYATEIEDANNAARMQQVVLPLAHLAHDTNTALLMLHHAKKSNGRYRDSSAIGGAVDLILEMMEPEGNNGDTLRVVKARGRFDTKDFRFRYVNSRHILAIADTEAATTEARVYEFVYSNPGASLREVRRSIGGRAEVADRALGTLLRTGRIEDTGTRRAHRYRVPFSDPQCVLDDA